MKAPFSLCLVLAMFSLHHAVDGQDAYWDNSYSGGGGATDGGGASSGGGGGLFGESQFSYGYFDLGYFVHAFDADGLDDANGFAGALSIPLADSLFVKAALGFASPEFEDGVEVDYIAWNLGGGIGLPIGGGAFDIVIEGGLAHRKLEGGAFEDPIDGYGFYVTPGVRLGLGELVELNGGVTFLNVESDSNVAVEAKALLHLTPNVSLFGSGTFAEEVNQYGVGLRLSF
jgi:hypothetical protein